MKIFKSSFLFLILFILLSACAPVFEASDLPRGEALVETDWVETISTQTQEDKITKSEEKPETDFVEPALSTFTPTPTPDPFTSFYGCQMEIKVLSGPLESKGSTFEVLGRDYFADKGDKFAFGKGTGVFYEQQRYLILHSSYINSNALRPMEAEFLRRYLENWGNHGPEYVQSQIESLIDSEILWICDGKYVFKTRVSGVSRLSYQASNRLWLNPQELEDILVDREGDQAEWIGTIPQSDEKSLYLGFCGWGPASLESERYTYYRYLIQFEIVK